MSYAVHGKSIFLRDRTAEFSEFLNATSHGTARYEVGATELEGTERLRSDGLGAQCHLAGLKTAAVCVTTRW